jgi:hypothetical protein
MAEPRVHRGGGGPSLLKNVNFNDIFVDLCTYIRIRILRNITDKIIGKHSAIQHQLYIITILQLY